VSLVSFPAYDVVSPNVDTVYCSAWLDLSHNPVVLNVPDTDDRYYVVQIMDAYSNTFIFNMFNRVVSNALPNNS
jgi:hypothetical protein